MLAQPQWHYGPTHSLPFILCLAGNCKVDPESFGSVLDLVLLSCMERQVYLQK